jgi:LuxR family maltose regulon positive regulatory protein
MISGFTRRYDFVWLFEKAVFHGRLSGYVSKPPVSIATIGSYVCRIVSPEREEAEKYIAALDAIEPYISQAMGGCNSGAADLARAELAYFRGETGEAERYAGEAIKKAREGEQYEIENRGLFYLMRIYLSRGDFEELRRIRAALDSLREKPYYLNQRIQCDIAEGWLAVQLGFTERLAPWLKNDFEESDLNSMGQGLEILIKVKYHFSKKKYPAALAILEARKDVEGQLALGKIENLALMAVCRYAARDREGAYAALAEAYALARPLGLITPFAEMGRHMRALADSALRDSGLKDGGLKDSVLTDSGLTDSALPGSVLTDAGIPEDWLLEIRRGAAAYAQKLFAAQEIYRPLSRTQFDRGPPVSLLSRREQEILYGLSRGLTRGEIASSLFLSINTVKSVIRSIYSKLGAVNRADAVRIATAQGALRTEDTSAGGGRT